MDSRGERMQPNTDPKDYVYKDGFYHEGETAWTRPLTGEVVRPYTTPEALARKVLGVDRRGGGEGHRRVGRSTATLLTSGRLKTSC